MSDYRYWFVTGDSHGNLAFSLLERLKGEEKEQMVFCRLENTSNAWIIDFANTKKAAKQLAEEKGIELDWKSRKWKVISSLKKASILLKKKNTLSSPMVC